MVNISKITINKDSTIEEIAKKIQKSGYKLCFVIGSDNALLGVVTDSELRRALLRGISKDCSVLAIMNDNPVISYQILKPVVLRKYYDAYNITHIPIIDKNNKLIDVIECKNNTYAETKCCSLLIIAGGQGSRLGKLTKSVPKPLVKVGGVTLIEHVIFNALTHGIKNIVIAVQYLFQKSLGNQPMSRTNLR